MADTTRDQNFCLFFGDLTPDSSSASPPQASCGGAPPADAILCYSYCLDCDLLHQRGARSIFQKISSRLKKHCQSVSARQASLDDGFASITKMLERLSIGDPDARVQLPEDDEIFLKLEPLFNRVADFIKDLVDSTHETAIGLCEHYEVLLQLAAGSRDSRASISSPIELIAKLGELINSQADTFTDVIKYQHEQERELYSLNLRLKGIIDFLPDATFVIDADHLVIAWNKAMAELSGVPQADIIGRGNDAYSMAFYGAKRPLLIDLVGDDPDVACQLYQVVEKHGNTLVAEGYVPTGHDGKGRHLWITASPLFDSDGAVIGAIESIRDITEHKIMESEKEILKEQLHHSQKLESVGELAGGIAHEFNNILAAIIGYAGILEMRLGADSPHLTAVQRIVSASEKAASLTRGMLTFSRKQIMTMELIHFNSFLFGMKEMLHRLAGENVQFELQVYPHDIIVYADLGQLQQIVLNLYNNARDAMPEGGRLSMSTGLRKVMGNETDVPSGIKPGRYLLLSISDTGCGIAADYLERIFDPFFTTKEVGKGTGLGLSMVLGIVQQHGGHIQVKTAPGKGTTFSVWLPEYVAKADVVSTLAPADKHNVSLRPQKILIGEDNEDVRPMIAELLQDFGYQVAEARDGLEVVEFMESQGDTVDLLLMDVIMPRMNGYEALSAVRERYPEIPCIFLSGYNDEILQQKAKIPGKFEYLSKPILPDKLIAAVRAALDFG
jgi:signal transduction histidine kinase